MCFTNRFDQEHKRVATIDYDRYSVITGTDSKKHFYPKEHYEFFYESLEAFSDQLRKWRNANYHGVVSVAPPTWTPKHN